VYYSVHKYTVSQLAAASSLPAHQRRFRHANILQQSKRAITSSNFHDYTITLGLNSFSPE
jgi:hypothetical protein